MRNLMTTNKNQDKVNKFQTPATLNHENIWTYLSRTGKEFKLAFKTFPTEKKDKKILQVSSIDFPMKNKHHFSRFLPKRKSSNSVHDTIIFLM